MCHSAYPIFTNLLRLKRVYYNQGSPVDLYYKKLSTEFDLALRGKKTAAQAIKDLQINIQQEVTKALDHYHG